MSAPTKIAELLGVLARHRVDFIVVGGVAAVIQGAPVNTFDLDVVHARTPDNIERLLGALRELDAVYRIDLKRRLSPTASHLASTEHQLLATNMGTLDLLGTIEEGTSYEELLADSEELDLGGIPLRVITLERLIVIKEKLTRPKDQVMLQVLRATLDERRRS
ncbi:nucleotidyltransferase [Sorangium sp. So ce131]|uniref:nucleotidyltransferase n=1 Tax=Sorangium sp. So ce131 TaxID=3133282 RepID=UPI003F6290FC